jgi:hypothetical protein
MRAVFRIVMLLANTGALIAILAAFLFTPGPSKSELPLVYAIIAGLIGNIAYIALYPRRDDSASTPRIRTKSRIRTIVGLWLDAKERELRDRAGKP